MAQCLQQALEIRELFKQQLSNFLIHSGGGYESRVEQTKSVNQ